MLKTNWNANFLTKSTREETLKLIPLQFVCLCVFRRICSEKQGHETTTQILAGT